MLSGCVSHTLVRRFGRLHAPRLGVVAINLSLIGHFTTFVSGSLFLSDAGYYLTLSMLALFLTTRVVTDR